MARADQSILSLLEEPQKPSAEIAATVEQQRMMENAGQLQPVHFVGPHGRLIEGFFSPEEKAFLPKFKV